MNIIIFDGKDINIFVSVTDKAKKYSPLAVIADLIRDPLKQKGLLYAKEMADVPPP